LDSLRRAGKRFAVRMALSWPPVRADAATAAAAAATAAHQSTGDTQQVATQGQHTTTCNEALASMVSCRDYDLPRPPGQYQPEVCRHRYSPRKALDQCPQAMHQCSTRGLHELTLQCRDYGEMAAHAPSSDMVPPSKFQTVHPVRSKDSPVCSNVSLACTNCCGSVHPPPPHCTVAQGSLAYGMTSVRGRQPYTTLCISNIPFAYNQQELMEELFWLVGNTAFNFFYLNPGKKNMVNRGFGFMNCVNEQAARWCACILSGHVWQRHQSADLKEAVVTLALIQGFEANWRARCEAATKKRKGRRGSGAAQQHPGP